MIDFGLRLKPYGYPHHAVPSRGIKKKYDGGRPRPARYFKGAQAFKKLGRHVARRAARQEIDAQLQEPA